MVFLLESHVREALDLAGVHRSALRRDDDPDSGARCLRLNATAQQYGLFLVALAQRFAHLDRDDQIVSLAGQAQLQTGSNGDTVFWLQGVKLLD
jgi:hypothetical protein